MINQSLHMELEKQDDLKLFHKKFKQEQHFSLFAYQDEDAWVTYRIIKNRSDQGYYLDELKNLDYLVHIQGELITQKLNLFITAVGALDTVRMCVPVNLKTLRSMERLLLW